MRIGLLADELFPPWEQNFPSLGMKRSHLGNKKPAVTALLSEVLKDKRAEYGEQVVKVSAKELTAKYGRGFSMRNLYNFISFYQNHPNIFHAVSGISDNILQSLTAKSQNDDQSNFFASATCKNYGYN